MIAAIGRATSTANPDAESLCVGAETLSDVVPVQLLPERCEPEQEQRGQQHSDFFTYSIIVAVTIQAEML